MFGSKPSTFHIDRKTGVKRGLSENISGCIPHRQAGTNVVVHDVQPMVFAVHRCQQRLNFSFMGLVHLHRLGRTACRLDHVHCFLCRCHVTVDHHHMRTLTGQHDAGGTPIANRQTRRLSAAKNHRQFVGHTIAHDVS